MIFAGGNSRSPYQSGAGNNGVMTSLRRRTSAVDMEKEDFEKSQAMAAGKAMSTQEMATKEKHVRSLILGTHKEHGAGTFWACCHRLPLDGNPIVCWKFCHSFHKMMRDGHRHVLADSMKYRSKIADLGKLWGHLKDGYGPLIKLYCQLLLTKLKFHHQNPRIPGNLLLTDHELEAIGEKDVNAWFELSVEMLDYLEDILKLQQAVFNSMDMSRATSMTRGGQCRLAPMMLCILDSSCLYDYVVKMVFKLHANLPPDVLVGHRDRFYNQFRLLKQFYDASRTLQYYKNLISVPCLPDKPPDFLSASSFADYVSPQARMLDGASEAGESTPPDAGSLAGDILVDFNEPLQQESPSKRFDELFGQSMDRFNFNGESNEKDEQINRLQSELEDAKATILRLQQQLQQLQEQYRTRISALENDLKTARKTIDQMTEENDRYREQAEQLQNEKNQFTAAKFEETEKKAQSSEEKFKKMRDVYNKLREEHIETLKKLSNLQKDFETAKVSQTDTETEKLRIEAEIAELRLLRSKQEADLVQSSAKTQKFQDEFDSYKQRAEKMQMDFNFEKENLLGEINGKKAEILSLQEKVEKLSTEILDSEKNLWEILAKICLELMELTKERKESFENPAFLTNSVSPEFTLVRLIPLEESIENLEKFNFSGEKIRPELFGFLISVGEFLDENLVLAKSLANVAPVDAGAILSNHCNAIAQAWDSVLNSTKNKATWSNSKANVQRLLERVRQFGNSVRNLLGKIGDIKAEELGSMIEKEMRAMDAAIQEAAAKIQDIIKKAKETNTGLKLEVNEKILATCQALMMAIIELVRRARDLQNEIVAQGKGAGSTHEFYARHHQWTEGLLSAAKAVGVGAKVLMETADKVILGDGKFEELTVAAQEIAASTAHLVIASRVKAERDSPRLGALQTASKGVSTCTANVVGTVKSAAETLQEQESLDFSHLSLHQAKRMEMESKVRIQELGDLLTKEHRKLAELRRKHYELAGPAAGWDEDSMNT